MSVFMICRTSLTQGYSRPHRPARLATSYRPGRSMGYSHPSIQHSACLLRRLPKWDCSCQPPPGPSKCTFTSFAGPYWFDCHSATTSVLTHSVFFLAKRTPNSNLAKIFVRTMIFHYHQGLLIDILVDVNWTGRGGNVSASTYNT